MLLHREQLLKPRIVADWVPDGIDFQVRDGNVADRVCELAAKNCHGVGRATGSSFDLRESRQDEIAKDCVFLGRQERGSLSREPERVAVTFQCKVTPGQ